MCFFLAEASLANRPDEGMTRGPIVTIWGPTGHMAHCSVIVTSAIPDRCTISSVLVVNVDGGCVDTKPLPWTLCCLSIK